MGAPRRKNLIISSRRRVDDEGEEGEGSIPNGLDDDSLSEGSALSDADDDADAEASEVSDVDSIDQKSVTAAPGANGFTGGQGDHSSKSILPTKKPPLTLMKHDTEAMMNGLKFTQDGNDEDEVLFDEMGTQSHAEPVSRGIHDSKVASVTEDTVGEKRRREHEEYKRKRDTDPAFVPNRGGFFMHDHRSAAPGQNGFRPFIKGRGRGRGMVETSSPAFRSQSSQPSGPSDAQWAHDLHETVTQPPADVNAMQNVSSQPYTQIYSRPASIMPKGQAPTRSFSKTTQIGNIQIRVYLAGMSSPITFSAVPVHQHTRLPHHRPPLRRDKPVRVALPTLPVQYIFPSTDRSFIFIPRALRPNQQGFGRAKQRGSFGGHSGLGGLSSRRTSAYAGSTHSPSVAMSRRSSLARELSGDGIISPGGPGRILGVPTDLGKPRVRLPPAIEKAPNVIPENMARANVIPIVNLPQHDYSLPEKPTFRENRPASIPIHQPRPQKTVSVAGIDSPATMDFNPPPQQHQQPFHQQVPLQVSGSVYVPDMSLLPHSRHASYPSQASGGTPLSQIPERAIHAPPFQPYPYQPPHNFYPPPYPLPVFLYPPAEPISSGVSSIGPPPFVPGQPYPYPVAVVHPPPRTEPTTQAGTVAHESNGMVYYYDSAQLAATAEGSSGYPVPGYSVPQAGGVIGMGGMMTPPVQYYPQPSPAGYYPA